MLKGVNKKCQSCSESCKQPQSISVVYCPFYKKLVENINESKKLVLDPDCVNRL